MQVYEGHERAGGLPAPAIALGNFDGVHLGHRALLDRTIAAARGLGGTALALTFDPHPIALLAPHLAPAQICTRARKLELLAAAGLDGCVVEPFTPATASLPAAAFVDDILVAALGVRHVVVGWDFTYGQGRGGTASTLEHHGARAGFAVEVVGKVELDGEQVSSTRIRGYLRGGDLPRAERLLGRRYDLDGVVVHGAKRGRELGVPTANIRSDGDVLIGQGIYAVRLAPAGGAPLDAVASIGTNPTFVDAGGLSVEVHVLDWSGDLYDQRVRVTFLQRLRDERRFDSVDELVAQMRADIAAARQILGAAGG